MNSRAFKPGDEPLQPEPTPTDRMGLIFNKGRQEGQQPSCIGTIFCWPVYGYQEMDEEEIDRRVRRMCDELLRDFEFAEREELPRITEELDHEPTTIH